MIERDDCIVVRTPGNPTFYWGNCLVLPAPPGDADLAHWQARFDAEIGNLQPDSRHVAIGVAAPWPGMPLPRWEAAGFAVHRTTMLRLAPDALLAPCKPPRGAVELRALDMDTESESLVDLESTDAGGFELGAYREYLRRQHGRYRTMHAAGLLQWFGLWCDGTLAASCGLLRDSAGDGAMGRFQRVITHPAWRRRGLCTALVQGVSHFALANWRVREVYMAADPDDVAIGIYRALGYVPVDGAYGLQRNAPGDG